MMEVNDKGENDGESWHLMMMVNEWGEWLHCMMASDDDKWRL